MTGDALEQALALQRAPFLRQTLRTRPLPDDIGGLIQIASGSPALLAEAARSSGETEPHVLEAVRFMLQEALFFPDADAYRVLGVEPDAPASRIREHYRWLQRWLHPDRRDGEWETIFATRVNAAWGQLRTAQARSRYDASRIQDHESGLVAMAPGRMRMSNVEHPGRDRSRLLALAAVSGCLLLVIVLARREDRPPDWGGNGANVPVAAGDDAPMPASPRRGTISDMRPPIAVAAQNRRAAVVRPGAAATTMSDRMPETARPTIQISSPTIIAGPAFPQLAIEPAPPPRKHPMRAQPIRESRPLASSSLLDPAPPAPEAVAARTQATTQAIPLPANVLFDPAQRMQLAGTRTRQIVRYLGDPAARAPPIWNDLRSQLRAERNQQALQARLSDGGRITVELQDPHWRLGERDAWLLTNYRVQGSRGRGETGVLTLGLTWREGMWLVNEISLDPSS